MNFHLRTLGVNNFEGNVVLKEFQLPSDSPEGGINFYTVTTLVNPRYVTMFRLDVLPSNMRFEPVPTQPRHRCFQSAL
jgi:hypothetical protein